MRRYFAQFFSSIVSKSVDWVIFYSVFSKIPKFGCCSETRKCRLLGGKTSLPYCGVGTVRSDRVKKEVAWANVAQIERLIQEIEEFG